MKHVMVVGTSEPQDFLLQDRGAPVSGADIASIELVMSRDDDGDLTPVVSPPTVAWISESGGTVRVTGAESLEVGNYWARFKLTDSGGRVGFVPTGERADVWVIKEVAAR